MAPVMFIGDGRDDPLAVELSGVTFPLGEIVDVPDIEFPELLFKLRGNSHFLVFDGLSVGAARQLVGDGVGPPTIDIAQHERNRLV